MLNCLTKTCISRNVCVLIAMCHSSSWTLITFMHVFYFLFHHSFFYWQMLDWSVCIEGLDEISLILCLLDIVSTFSSSLRIMISTLLSFLSFHSIDSEVFYASHSLSSYIRRDAWGGYKIIGISTKLPVIIWTFLFCLHWWLVWKTVIITSGIDFIYKKNHLLMRVKPISYDLFSI